MNQKNKKRDSRYTYLNKIYFYFILRATGLVELNYNRITDIYEDLKEGIKQLAALEALGEEETKRNNYRDH